VTKVGS